MVKTKAKAATRAASRPASRGHERRQALRVALIDAAEASIAARGLAGLNARELAREVGCALGAIYNVFPDLDSIVYEVNARTLAAFEAFVTDRDRRSKSGNRRGARADLVALAGAYLDFAVANQPRWRTLFEHRPSALDAVLPDWYRDEQNRMFSLVERPLGALRPDLGERERMLFARTMFSAVHGVVDFGLDEKLMTLPIPVLAKQVRMFVGTLADGLVAAPPRG